MTLHATKHGLAAPISTRVTVGECVIPRSASPRAQRGAATRNLLFSGAKSILRRSAVALSLFALATLPAFAGTVTGVVHNGTDGKVASGVDMILIQLQGGMQPVANTKTDAAGNYKFDNPSIGQGPMLIRAVYHGVMFHQPLVPGRATVDVTVYDPTSDPKSVQVGSRLIVLQPNGSNLMVGEEYALQNNSKPPLAYFNEKGDFSFQIPPGAELSQVSSWGPSGMPVVQGTIDKGKQKYAIAYAFQPGDNGVRMSYQLPYPSNQTQLRFTSDYNVGRVMLVAPPTVQVASDGFAAAGTEQGFNLYTRDNVSAGLPFDVSISGTAPPPSADGQSSAGAADAGAPPDEANGHVDAQTIQAMPNRLDSLRWILIGGLAALFALGLVFVWRQQGIFSLEAAAIPAPVASPKSAKAVRKQQAREASAARPAPPAASPVAQAAAPPSVPVVTSAAPAAAPAAATSVAAVEQEVEQSLDGLKDKLFRLELRRQAGTISEEDYLRERNRTEQVLRELVRG